MLNIGWSELLVIGVVTLIVIGPNELPSAMRTLGKFVSKARNMVHDLRSQFDEALREAELSDLKKQVAELRDATQKFNPVNLIKSEVMNSLKDIDEPFDAKSSSVQKKDTAEEIKTDKRVVPIQPSPPLQGVQTFDADGAPFDPTIPAIPDPVAPTPVLVETETKTAESDALSLEKSLLKQEQSSNG